MSKQIYLPGLNGIRAIAAMLVLVFHIDQSLPHFGHTSFGYYRNNMAAYAVYLFFVLSGFLITFLLLKEKEKTGTVKLRAFYIRRILRIWPVYYITIAAAVVLCLASRIPVAGFSLYIVFLANFAHAWRIGFDTIAPLWSVGVEEQFYLIWPVVMRKTRNVLKVLVIFLVMYLLVKACALLSGGFVYQLFNDVLPIDCMAIGGISAVMLKEKSKWLKYIYHPAAQVFSWAFLLVSIFYKPIHVASIIDRDIHSVVYAVIILNVCSNPKNLISLEYPVLNYLGKISYGLYAYHMTAMYVLYKFILPKGVPIALIYTLVIGGSILIASLSWYLIERRFDKLKSRFAVIKSTNRAQERIPDPGYIPSKASAGSVILDQ